jgi:hypothetical protein
MKLSKVQADALAHKIFNEIYEVTKDRNKIIKDKAISDFLKTDVGKAVTKVNNAFFSMQPISNGSIETLALKYYEKVLHKSPSTGAIYNDIVLASIDSTDLNALIETIKARHNVQENDEA